MEFYRSIKLAVSAKVFVKQGLVKPVKVVETKVTCNNFSTRKFAQLRAITASLIAVSRIQRGPELALYQRTALSRLSCRHPQFFLLSYAAGLSHAGCIKVQQPVG